MTTAEGKKKKKLFGGFFHFLFFSPES